MKLEDSNPFVRTAELQPAILEGTGLRRAYDHRLFYILEGSGYIQLGADRHPIQPDSLILLPPAVSYDFGGKLKVAVLNFDVTRTASHRKTPLFPPRVELFQPELVFDRQTIDGFSSPQVFRADAQLQERVLALVSRFQPQNACADAAVSAGLKLLLSDLLSRSLAPEDRLSQKLLGYIRVHAATLSDNASLAAAFGYHPVYLNELLRKTTGKTLHAAILEARLHLACRWLRATETGIEQVAEECGFCSRAHLCTTFKKYYGCTPSQYRKQHTTQTQRNEVFP